ncbi:MAG: HDOD domain-containing protein [Burkholderiaceae bacterium]
MDEPELVDKELERVALSIGIPPCPAILLELSAETKKDAPDFAKIESLISKDVGLSATLLKTVNSPFYGLRTKVNTTKQAIAMLGLSMLSRTITGLVLRQAFASKDAISMERFWDASAKVAIAASFIAKRLPGMSRDEAYTFGLFQNCGIPILMQRFPNYKETLGIANNTTDKKFTDIEDAAHGTDHATMGYLLTKSWNLPDVLAQAIRFHHEYSVLENRQSTLPIESQSLIAIGLLADHLVQIHSGKNFSVEWLKGGPIALNYLGLSDDELEDIYDEGKHLLE